MYTSESGGPGWTTVEGGATLFESFFNIYI